VGGQRHATSRQKKEPVPCGRVRKISPTLGFESQAVQPVAITTML